MTSLIRKFCVFMSVFVVLMTSAKAQTTDIYQPKVLVAGVSKQESIERTNGSWGFGVGQVAQENLTANMAFTFGGRYFAGERWYVLANLQSGTFSDRVIADAGGQVLVKKDVTSVLVNSGLGYNLMQGSASFSGVRAYPWQLGIEAYLGEQFTGDSSGRYTGLGLSWQLIMGKRWLSLDSKTFQINDDNLKQAKVSKGIQWGLSFGSYF